MCILESIDQDTSALMRCRHSLFVAAAEVCDCIAYSLFLLMRGWSNDPWPAHLQRDAVLLPFVASDHLEVASTVRASTAHGNPAALDDSSQLTRA